MRLITIAIVSVMAANISMARTTKTTKSTSVNQTKFDVRVPIKNFFNKYKKDFKFGVAKGSMDMNLRARTRASDGVNRNDDSGKSLEQTNYQFHIGYEEITLKQPGFSTFVVYQDIGTDGGDARNIRITGNVTYGLTKQAYTYGGLNYGKYYGPGDLEDIFSAGIGYQAGIGLNLHKRLNLEAEYVTLLNEGSKDGVNFDMASRGLLVKLNTPLFL